MKFTYIHIQIFKFRVRWNWSEIKPIVIMRVLTISFIESNSGIDIWFVPIFSFVMLHKRQSEYPKLNIDALNEAGVNNIWK